MNSAPRRSARRSTGSSSADARLGIAALEQVHLPARILQRRRTEEIGAQLDVGPVEPEPGDSLLEALVDELRFDEALDVASIVEEVDPDGVVPRVATLWSRLRRNDYLMQVARAARWQNYFDTLYQVELSSIPFPDDPPIVYPDAPWWKEMSVRRKDRYGSMDLKATGEAEQRIDDSPRASTTQPPTLAILAELGLIDEYIAQGLVARTFQFWDRPTLALVAEFDFERLRGRTAFPFVVQTEQHKLAHMGLERLRRMDNATVVLGARVTGLSQDASSVTVFAGDDRYEADYVIACDGGRCTSRGRPAQPASTAIAHSSSACTTRGQSRTYPSAVVTRDSLVAALRLGSRLPDPVDPTCTSRFACCCPCCAPRWRHPSRRRRWLAPRSACP